MSVSKSYGLLTHCTNFCVSLYNFIRREQSKRCAYYSLTDRGRTILNLFMEKGG